MHPDDRNASTTHISLRLLAFAQLADWATRILKSSNDLKPCALKSSMATADPVTQAWMAEHKELVFGFPGLVRFSWAGTVRILAEHGAPVSWCAAES